MNKNPTDNTARKVVLVTGPSGAGRSTAINVLEDLGFEAIDNLPLSLLPHLLDGPIDRPLAIGLDVRNRDFAVNAILDTARQLIQDTNVASDLLYLDCDGSPEAGIAAEIEILSPIRHQASVLVDTTDLSPHDLRDALKEWFDPSDTTRMSVSVHSFSYKRGTPPGVDMVFDCRFLRNPHWEPDLRGLDGRDTRVAAYVEEDPRCSQFYDGVSDLVTLLLPAFKEEGKAHLTIGFGCTGGQHRSVAMAEKLMNGLANQGWYASIRHRELERRAKPVPVPSGVET